jgi:hypothetical protein
MDLFAFGYDLLWSLFSSLFDMTNEEKIVILWWCAKKREDYDLLLHAYDSWSMHNVFENVV